MAYAITQPCCSDASCVSVCPVNCIHPTPEERGFGSTEILHIDPQVCIDCGACADACPVDAILPVDQLRGSDVAYADLNKDYYADDSSEAAWAAPRFPASLPDGGGGLRVAVVGTGPAASYAVQSLLRTGADVSLIDRLPVPGGLLRYGVAPDHPATKRIADRFASIYQHPRVRLFLNVEVGVDVTHDEIAEHHHAVVYAVGAAGHRPLEVDGAQLDGVVSAHTLVAWYNAHPDASSVGIDLTAERAVVIGNGNVAIDVARVLLASPDALARTDISDRALGVLRTSRVREVVLLGRRGPEHAAYSREELVAIRDHPDLSLVVDGDEEARAAIAGAETGSKAALLRDLPCAPLDWSQAPPAGKRIVLRFSSSPTELVGEDHVEAVRVSGPGRTEIPTSLVLPSIGSRGAPVSGLPFDTVTGTVPHREGRVVDPQGDRYVEGAYVTGWIKRGPTGGIGANRTCADETVAALLADVRDGKVSAPARPGRSFRALLRARRPDLVEGRQLAAIDRAERERGAVQGRPRVKFETTADLLAAGRSSRWAAKR